MKEPFSKGFAAGMLVALLLVLVLLFLAKPAKCNQDAFTGSGYVQWTPPDPGRCSYSFDNGHNWVPLPCDAKPAGAQFMRVYESL